MKQLFQAISRTEDGAFVIDEQQHIIFWNQAAQTILGFTPEETINRPCYEVLCGVDETKHTLCQRYCRVAITTLQGGILPNLDMYTLNKAGERRWINVTTLALPAEKQGLSHIIVHLFRDATRRKNNERFIKEIMAVTNEHRSENGSLGPPMAPADILTDPGLETLTPREREVLLLLANGLGTDEIAGILSISQATTRNHIQGILNKLSVHSRLEAVAYAYQNGLVEGNDQ